MLCEVCFGNIGDDIYVRGWCLAVIIFIFYSYIYLQLGFDV